MAKQLAEAAARARGEVDAARANLKETAPQVFEAKSLESQVSLVACSKCLAAPQLSTVMCSWRKSESYGPLLKTVQTGNQLLIASMKSQHFAERVAHWLTCVASARARHRNVLQW